MLNLKHTGLPCYNTQLQHNWKNVLATPREKNRDTLRRQNRLRPGHREDDPFNIRKYKIFLCKGIISKTSDGLHLEEETSAIVSYAKVICLAIKTEVTWGFFYLARSPTKMHQALTVSGHETSIMGTLRKGGAGTPLRPVQTNVSFWPCSDTYSLASIGLSRAHLHIRLHFTTSECSKEVTIT